MALTLCKNFPPIQVTSIPTSKSKTLDRLICLHSLEYYKLLHERTFHTKLTGSTPLFFARKKIWCVSDIMKHPQYSLSNMTFHGHRDMHTASRGRHFQHSIDANFLFYYKSFLSTKLFLRHTLLPFYDDKEEDITLFIFFHFMMTEKRKTLKLLDDINLFWWHFLFMVHDMICFVTNISELYEDNILLWHILKQVLHSKLCCWKNIHDAL